MSSWELGLLVLSLGFAGLVKGVTGFGLPLFATPILAGLFGARQAVVIMSIPAILSNMTVLYSCRRDLSVIRKLWPVMVAGAVGVVAGVNRSSVTIGLLSLVPTLLAVAIGVRVRDRLNTGAFHRVISLLLALSAINLIAQGLRGFGVFS